MTEIIEALQEEISAAQKKRAHMAGNGIAFERDEYARLAGYIQGFNQALYLLTKEPVGASS